MYGLRTNATLVQVGSHAMRSTCARSGRGAVDPVAGARTARAQGRTSCVGIISSGCSHHALRISSCGIIVLEMLNAPPESAAAIALIKVRTGVEPAPGTVQSTIFCFGKTRTNDHIVVASL